MKKLFFISFFALLVLSGCQNEDEGKSVDLTADEARELVTNSGTALSDDIVSLIESEGVNALMHFAELMEGSSVVNGRTSPKSWTKERLDVIIQHFIKGPAARVGNDEPASFDEIKGLYTWNSELQDFDFEESEFFIVRFPSEGSASNNAELKISNLQFVAITETDGDLITEYEVPSVIEGYLKVDEETLVELSFNINWSSVGFPEKADVSLFIKPFTFAISFDDTFPTSASLLTSIAIDEQNIVAIDLDVQFEDQDKEDPYFFEGFVQYRDVKIQGNVDVREIGIDSDPNDFINLDIYSDDSKIGDIIFVLEEDDEGYDDYIPYVKYSDGSTQSLDEILAPVFAEIESIFAEFED